MMVLESVCGLSQTADSIVHTEKPAYLQSQLRNPTTVFLLPEPSQHFDWKCLGPNSMPSEDNQSGTGVPAYARGRGAGTGRINYLYAHRTDASKLWACSPTGGLWYTMNEGVYWHEGGTDALPVSGVSSVAVNEKNPKQWVIATGDGDDQFTATNGLWLTRNRGKKYVCINGDDPSTALPFHLLDTPTFIGEVVSNPIEFNFLIVASSRGLWVCEDVSRKSSDYGPLGWLVGRTKRVPQWKRVAQGVFYDIEWLHSYGKGNVVVAGGDQLWVSEDAGITWAQHALPDLHAIEKFPFRRIVLNYTEFLPGKLYVLITCSERPTQSKSGPAQLYIYDLNSREWEFVRSMEGDAQNIIPTRARAFEVDSKTTGMACANVQPIMISNDGGRTFDRIEKNQMHDDVHHILQSPSNGRLWASHDGGVSSCEKDDEKHWQSRCDGIGAANVFGIATSQSKDVRLAFGGYDVGGNYYKNGTWRHVSWGDGFECAISAADRNVVFTTSQNGAVTGTLDGQEFNRTLRPNAKTEWHSWIRMHPSMHETVYCSGERLRRSNDLGENWETIFDCTKIDSSLHNAYRFFMAPEFPGTMYVYALNKGSMVQPQLWVTHNVLASNASDIQWRRVSHVPLEGWIASVEIDPADSTKFWLLYQRRETSGKLWYFDGNRFNDVSGAWKDALCESMVLQRGDRSRLYVGSDRGVFTSEAHKNEWLRMAGLPGTQVKSLVINYATNSLIAGTFGRGLWQVGLIKP
ncbi:MAG: WD40/YVTN/BNR-like repeat-containing protein [Flavobacteriales bacterium]